MVTRSWTVCAKIMDYLVKEGFTNQVQEHIVEKAIIFVRGADKRTLHNWKRALQTLGFIEKIVSSPKNSTIFKMNLLCVPDLLTTIVKRDDRQQKLM